MGIDLGTATTVVATYEDGQPRVFGDERVGIPSLLAVTEEGIAVGDAVAADASSVRLLPHQRSPAANDSAREGEPGTLPLSLFLKRVLDETAVDDEDATLLAAPDREETAAPPTVLTVPGAYTRDDVTLVERAARAAGLERPTVVRSPLPVAASELLAEPPEEPEVVAVVDVGVEWCDLAVVRGGPGPTVDVLARESLPGHGRRLFDEHLARWALAEEATDRGAEVEVTDDGMAPLTEAAHDALAAVEEDEPVSLAVDLDEGIDVVEGGWFGGETLAVDVDVDRHACYEALEDPLDDLEERLDALLAAADATTEDIERVVVAGHGTAPTPVVSGFENYFGREARPPTGETRYTASASGAARLAASLARGENPIGTETLDRTVEVKVLGPDESEFRSVASSRTRVDERPSVRLQTTVADRSDGYFEVWYRDDVRESREKVASFVVSGLPRGESPGVDLDVTVEFDSHRLSSDRPPTVTASLTDESDPEEWDPSVAVSTGDRGGAPWLAAVEHDPEAIDGSRAGDERSAAVTVRDPERTALAELSEAGLAEAVHGVRTKLWRRGVKNDADLESGELATLVRELDAKLAGEGVEFVQPATGEAFDATRHEITRAEEATEAEGTILELEEPGLVVDGHVVRPARVVVAG